jgi:toxin YoeB
VRVHFTASGWDDYQYWIENDPAVLVRLNVLIRDARRNPFTGIGKPEPLKRQLSGWWSRRISGEHRLVYRVEGKAGADQRIEIVTCRYHYD